MSDNVKLHPAWRAAVFEILQTRPKPGDVISRVQLEVWMDMKRPSRGTYDEVRSYELRFLSARDRCFDELLRKHQIQFEMKDTAVDGWRVLAPSEVAAFTRRNSDRELKKTLRKQRERLAHTDLSELTPAQLLEHGETLVRCSWKLRAMKDVDRKPVELPSLPRPLPRPKK